MPDDARDSPAEARAQLSASALRMCFCPRQVSTVAIICCCWQSYESSIELQARVPLRLLAAGARLLFAQGDLGNILFSFYISSAKRCAPANATRLCLPLCEASRARVLNSISRALPPDLSTCVVCAPARRA